VAAARHRICWEKTTPVAVKIKLKRLGKIRAPYYRIVVADARTKRDGRAIEEIGKYHPKAEPSFIEVNSDRAQHWLSVGAQPTDPVRKILEITGDWQKFKGLPGTEGTLKTAAPRENRKEIFAAAVKETLGNGAAASKTKARSAGREAEPAAKGGRATAKDASPAKADKPARAKAGDQSAKAPSGESAGDAPATAAKAKSAEAKGTEAKSGAAKSAEAKSAEARSAEARSGAARSGAARSGAARSGAARSGAARSAEARSGGARSGAKGAAKDAEAKDGAAHGGEAKDGEAKDGEAADATGDAGAPASAEAAPESASGA
jgi:small subunit ribosomal protein S16